MILTQLLSQNIFLQKFSKIIKVVVSFVIFQELFLGNHIYFGVEAKSP